MYEKSNNMAMKYYKLNSIDYPEANINIISVCKIMEWNSWISEDRYMAIYFDIYFYKFMNYIIYYYNIV